MSSASSDDGETLGNLGPYIFYKDRPEWQDIEPLPQEDDDQVVAIDYSPEFTDVFNYFRAIIAKGEKSERALDLTHEAVTLNPANYTVWQYRREILKALGKDLASEMDYIETAILKQPKNYQVWHHRRILVELTNDPSLEKLVTEKALQKDAKNYHAWQHRQWAVKRYNLFQDELCFVDDLLTIDVRNNSAWNHRYFVINNSTGFTPNVIEKEITYTLQQITRATENESSWNYLRGILFHHPEGLGGDKQVTDFCENLVTSGNKSPFLLSLIVDICAEKASKGITDPQYNLLRGKALTEELATVDTIRKNYWKYIGENLGETIPTSGDSDKIL